MALLFTRVSKNCNHSITQLRKIIQNLCKILINELKTGYTSNNFMYLSKFFFFWFHMFLMSFLRHVPVQNIKLEHFDYAKEFAFRKSAYSHRSRFQWFPVYVSHLYGPRYQLPSRLTDIAIQHKTTPFVIVVFTSMLSIYFGSTIFVRTLKVHGQGFQNL